MSESEKNSNDMKSEFWLPPEFLTDDDILMDFKPKATSNKSESVVHFPLEYSKSGLSSPVDSFGSSECEEDDYLAHLTRKMANSTLLDHLWLTHTNNITQKNWGISVSPQSTLYGFKQDSSRGSPNCISPPPLTDRKDANFELLYLAAGEVARMRMIEEANAAYILNHGGFNAGHGFASNQNITYQQLQFAKFQQLKREQLMRQQQQQAFQMAPPRARTVDRAPLANLSQATWPTLQQSLQLPSQSQHQPANANGSGMRAVFLGPKRDSVGTGVFIPRRTDQPRKGSGGSTVLLPDRVVQALNLNLKPMDAQSRLMPSEIDGAVNMRNNVQMGQQQKMNIRPSSVAAHSDLRLPQEWTY